MGTGVKSAGA